MKYIRLKEDKSPYSNYNNTTEDLSSVFWDCVGLMIPDNIVVVDFDSRDDIALDILNKSNNKPRAVKSDRGVHLYYKIPKGIKIKNNNKVLTVLGCEVDYKTGQDNKKQYIIIKRFGKFREILNDVPLENLPEIPLELMPLKFKNSVTLVNLSAGSRNESIFKHLSNARSKYQELNNKNEVEALAFKINSYMSEPLEEKEIKSIVDSVIKYDVNYSYQDNEQFYITLKNGSKKINIFKLSDYLQNELKLTIFNNSMFFKINGTYTSDVNKLLTFIKKNLKINLTKKEDIELLHQLNKTENILDLNSNLFIRCNNYYSITQEAKVIKDNEDNFTPFYLDVEYNSKAYDENVYNFLMWFVSNDTEMFEYIKGVLGHILFYKNYPQVAFFFIGPAGKNGKSTFFKMLASVFENVVSFLSIEEMNKETNLPLMQNKLLNVGDDINNAYIENSSIFKRLTSSDVVMARSLFNMGKPQQNFATLLFSCNDMPTFKDKSGGIERRVRNIPCENTVADEEVDYSLIDKLTTPKAKSYLLNLALEGMRSILIQKGKMNEPQKVLALSKEYIMQNDSIKSFIEYLRECNISIHMKTVQSVYLLYCDFCNEYGNKNLDKSLFTRRFTKYLDLKTEPRYNEAGVSKRVFVRK